VTIVGLYFCCIPGYYRLCGDQEAQGGPGNRNLIKSTGVTETTVYINKNQPGVRENTGFKYTENRLGEQGTAGAK